MSLDVTLTVPGPDGPSVRAERIFIRRDGATVEVTRGEWDEMYPGHEPVTALAEIVREVYSANVTHNLGRMAQVADLYDVLWLPDENGLATAADLAAPLRAGLAALRGDRDHFETFNPENGWGDYDLLVRFTENYLAACERWPEAKVSVCG